MATWTLRDIPNQTGRLAIVTGATGGLGYDTALGLAGAGAEVILAGRNPGKGRDAMSRIHSVYPTAKVSFDELDLASLASVAAFAMRHAAEDRAVDLLVNNAGVMALPRRQVTQDGFEMQFGTNFLGHFALTAHLLPLLRRGRGTRVVNVGSTLARQGRIDFDDPQSTRSYSPWRAYAQSKLALLMFTLELRRRSDALGWGLMGLAAHPGWARTELMANGPNGWQLALSELIAPVFSQSSAAGALSILYAATSPQAVPAGYYGPTGFMELTGPPTRAKVPPAAQDMTAAARLWRLAEDATGAVFPSAVETRVA
jgi:NAD(P)-dependent dehydrogenase (short-subunit alcohol dehydrogenase family)